MIQQVGPPTLDFLILALQVSNFLNLAPVLDYWQMSAKRSSLFKQRPLLTMHISCQVSRQIFYLPGEKEIFRLLAIMLPVLFLLYQTHPK